MYNWEAGVPKLGATVESNGINFAIFAKNKKGGFKYL